jgi:hypothetical protein
LHCTRNTAKEFAPGVGFHARLKTLLQITLDSAVGRASNQCSSLGVLNYRAADISNTSADAF